MNTTSVKILVPFAIAGLLLVGCADQTANLSDPLPTSIKKIQAVTPTAMAGVDKTLRSQ